MLITLRPIGHLKELFPGNRERLELELSGTWTIKNIVTENFDVSPDSISAIVIKGKHRKWDYEPKDGDEILLIPPLGGG